ncbi:TPA: hypothetical protein QDZ46_002626, partial [Stenotrophomonas maltophilia]|nr:hypothetical protein [Stenotrophomonas maltophilia]
MNRDDPLTPEERALAGLIGRRAEQAPPPALDAAILAAARASVQTGATSPSAGAAAAAAPRAANAPLRRARPRWPAVFGIAASMVFAIGIAWQMRPEPPVLPAQEAQMAPAAAGASDAPAAEGASDAAEVAAAAVA